MAAVRSGPDLTATEQRVADLIASGASNREAATRLFVSVRTVEHRDVASIYRKLGVRKNGRSSRVAFRHEARPARGLVCVVLRIPALRSLDDS